MSYSNQQIRKHIFTENEPAITWFASLINSIKKSNTNRRAESLDCEDVSNHVVCTELTAITYILL